MAPRGTAIWHSHSFCGPQVPAGPTPERNNRPTVTLSVSRSGSYHSKRLQGSNNLQCGAQPHSVICCDPCLATPMFYFLLCERIQGCNHSASSFLHFVLACCGARRRKRSSVLWYEFEDYLFPRLERNRRGDVALCCRNFCGVWCNPWYERSSGANSMRWRGNETLGFGILRHS